MGNHGGTGGHALRQYVSSADTERNLPCPRCGLTLGDIAAAGRVGCAICYKTFGNELNTALSLLHGNAHHIGQCPVRYRERLQRAERIQALRERLREAVASEGYEEAVALRDEIRNLEKEDQ